MKGEGNMTWGEIQIESLKKMFLNKEVLKIEEIEKYKADKKYKTYLDAMPQACNEAINYIINLEPIIKVEELQKNGDNSKYDLKELFSDYKRFYNINSEYPVMWTMLTKNIIGINGWTKGNIDIYYEAYPKKVTKDTEISTKIDLEEAFSRIIPLYIAGELYKDDDLTLSTMYMNEFITNLNAMITNDNFTNNNIQSTYRMEW